MKDDIFIGLAWRTTKSGEHTIYYEFEVLSNGPEYYSNYKRVKKMMEWIQNFNY